MLPGPLSKYRGGAKLQIPRSGALIPYAAFVLFSLLFLGSGAIRDVISPYDELYYLGYVQYVYGFSIPRAGQTYLDWSMNAFSCMPVFPFGRVTSVPCGSFGPIALYPEKGLRSAQGWPPGYFVIAAGFEHLGRPFGIDPVLLARATSIALWTIGLTLIVGFIDRARQPRVLAFGTGTLLLASPLTDLYGRHVTPHSALPLIVGMSLFAGARISRADLPRVYWALLLVGLIVLTALTIPQAVPGVIAVAVAATIVAEYRRSPRGFDLRTAASWMAWLAIPFGGLVVLSRILPGRFPLIPGDLTTLATHIASSALHFWPDATTGDPLGVSDVRLLPYRVIALGLVMAAGACLSSTRVDPFIKITIISTTVAAVMSAVAFSFLSFAVPLRYGLVFGILAYVPLGFAGRSRTFGWAVLCLGVGMVILALLLPWPPINPEWN